MASAVSLGGIPFQRVDAEVTTHILQRALELGVNFIDTARGYTVSEQYIGEALKVVGREHFILATKSMKTKGEDILEELAISLKTLQTNYIDLYQFHNVGSLAAYEELVAPKGALEAVRRKKEEGVIGHIGLTTHRKDVLEQALKDDFYETIQFPFNPMERHGEALFKQAKVQDVGIIVMKPYAGGAIVNKEYALRFELEHEAVSIVIPGVDSLEQLEFNARLASPFVPLKPEERAIIEKEAKELGEHFCRRCGYCLPCAVEINIPMMFLLEGYYTRYNLKEWSETRYKAMDKKAKDCIACGLCESRCPYELPIIDMMKRTSHVMDVL